MKERRSGVLLHITSLPSGFGIGDLGPEACRFADFLAETRQGYWQILPLTPTDIQTGNSPYRSASAFAGNPLLISPELMAERGWLTPEELDPRKSPPSSAVDYESMTAKKCELYNAAFLSFMSKDRESPDYLQFCSENSAWLDNFALFMSLRKNFDGIHWSEWPEKLRDRDPAALEKAKADFSEQVEREKFLQFVFFSQWQALKEYCNQRGVRIIGDLPIYVSYDSADIWSRPGLWQLDEHKKVLFMAGVPPDYFSETGQLWEDPVYNWDELKKTGYEWWLSRIGHNLKLFDIVRIDHFRGFAAFWEVPAGEETAINGRWVDGPRENFFDAVLKNRPELPLIAEDLGVITPDVVELIDRYGFPGMKVLLFAFDESLPKNPYAPHNHVQNCVVYTGTHDNNTVRGWFEGEAAAAEKQRVFTYLGRWFPAREINWEFVRLAMVSVANTAIIPAQDLIGLGRDCRMNIPSTPKGNWEWRLLPGQITPELVNKLRELTEICGRV